MSPPDASAGHVMAVNPSLARWPQVPDTTTDNSAEEIASALTGQWPQPRTDDGVIALLSATDEARVLFPGPVGELIHREIHAYLELGHRFGGESLISRLATHLLAISEGQAESIVGAACHQAVLG